MDVDLEYPCKAVVRRSVADTVVRSKGSLEVTQGKRQTSEKQTMRRAVNSMIWITPSSGWCRWIGQLAQGDDD